MEEKQAVFITKDFLRKTWEQKVNELFYFFQSESYTKLNDSKKSHTNIA